MSAVVNTRMTPEEFEMLPDAVAFELVDGELVELNMAPISSWVSGSLVRLLVEYCEQTKWGWVFDSSCSYQCFADPDTVRRPDVSCVQRTRLPKVPSKGHLRIAPDVAVEVLSPNDLAAEVERKTQEYLDAGVRLVWIINPETRTVRVHRAGGTITGLTAENPLSGEAVLPGFECAVGRLFPPAANVE